MTKRAALMSSALVFAVVALAPVPVLAQANPRGEAKVTFQGKTVAIDYGRPSLRGRDMIAEAEVGVPWRMGADADTLLKTEADLSFGSVMVPKGDYVLKAKKLAAGTKLAGDKWQLIVHSSGRDGAVVAEIPLASSKLDQSVEMFTVELRGKDGNGEFEMKWGTTALKAPFRVK